ncbi:major facilitator superfamily domain-containing protein [Lophiotrema nucula]|uniref:Major facilitator superfamily domain-containing protein n=1 Tax=Lophiotrema nucula TaxID=690887 RepID=A0A6A5ZIS2_9PLEO|nr:major facilitator superfamily domain-containing protein [Lophiotrema nucula]
MSPRSSLEKQHSVYEQPVDGGDGHNVELPDPFIQKKLVRKLDVIILPLLAIIYFTHSLDRANLGNAKTDNFEKDIGLKDNQYSLILILFYIPYGTLNIPSTVLAKRFSPAVVIPILMFLWGTISLAAAAVHSFGGVAAARICLGVVEAGFFPSAIYYLTMFYTRYEIAKRISLFYMMGFVANAFSGLIAYSVFQWNAKLHNWQYLFIIEGALTMLLATICFILLPRNMQSTKYFTAAEKHCSSIRLLLAAASISNFLPTMIKRLTKDTITANLYTIAPNLNGAIWIIAMCWVSDRFQSRALCSMIAMGVSMIGFICLGTVDLVHQTGLGYFFTFMLTFGAFTPAVLVPAWTSSNITDNSARATTLGLLAGLQNIAGIISSYAFRSQDAPVYKPALVLSGCCQGGMVLLAGFAWFYYRRINKQLDRGERTSVRGMEQNPDFRYVL